MTITAQDVRRLARLARLELAESEIDGHIASLDRILGYIQLLQELDTTGVPAMSHVTVDAAPLREDVAATVLDRDEVLAEAPRRTDDGFAVPTFVDEG